MKNGEEEQASFRPDERIDIRQDPSLREPGRMAVQTGVKMDRGQSLPSLRLETLVTAEPVSDAGATAAENPILADDDSMLSPRCGIIHSGYEMLGGEKVPRSPTGHRMPRSPTGHRMPRSPSATRLHEMDLHGTSPVTTTHGRGTGGVSPGGEQGMTLWSFVAVEFLGERHSTGLDDSVPKAIDNFLAVPARFERFVAYGLLVSLDTFLDTVTLLPVRAFLAAVALGTRVWRKAARALGAEASGSSGSGTRGRRASNNRRTVPATRADLRGAVASLKFDRARAYDLMRCLTILACVQVLRLVPMSQAYHWIRGQNTIKLYVIIGIMEVFDRLACAFGQDALDSLYLATRHYRLRRVVLFLVLTNGVVLLHSGLLFVHITTLNVVVNASEDSAIVALMVSNNFSEIKSFVFKKYNAHNLFEVGCADVCERFKLCLFLSLLVLLSWARAGKGADPASVERRAQTLRAIFQQVVIVAGFEVVADWVKHAFIAKFNKLDAKVYDAYADRLARDVVTGRGGGIALDHTHAVTRRLGLAVLPLACVAHRYLSIALGWIKVSLEISNLCVSILVLLGIVCALQLKVLTSVVLAGVSLDRHDRALAQGGGADDKADTSSSAADHLRAKSARTFDHVNGGGALGLRTVENGCSVDSGKIRGRSPSFDDPRLGRDAIKSPTSPRFAAALRRHRKPDDDALAAGVRPRSNLDNHDLRGSVCPDSGCGKRDQPRERGTKPAGGPLGTDPVPRCDPPDLAIDAANRQETNHDRLDPPCGHPKHAETPSPLAAKRRAETPQRLVAVS